MSFNNTDLAFPEKDLPGSMNFQNFSRTPPTATPSSYGQPKFFKRQRTGSIASSSKGEFHDSENFINEGIMDHRRPSLELLDDLDLGSFNVNQVPKDEFLTFQFDIDENFLTTELLFETSNSAATIYDSRNQDSRPFHSEISVSPSLRDQAYEVTTELISPIFSFFPTDQPLFEGNYNFDPNYEERQSLDLENSFQDHNSILGPLQSQISVHNLDKNQADIFLDHQNQSEFSHKQGYYSAENSQLQQQSFQFESHSRSTSNRHTRSSTLYSNTNSNPRQSSQQPSNVASPSGQVFSISNRVTIIPSLKEVSNVLAPPYDQLVNFPRAKTKENVRCVMCGKSPRDGNCSIPSQNKDVCKECDKSNWFHAFSSIYFKWCKGCKNFLNICQFVERLDASKCDRCRARGRQGYLQKKGRDNGRGNSSPQYQQHYDQPSTPSSSTTYSRYR